MQYDSPVGPGDEPVAPPDPGEKSPATPGDVLAALLPWGRERLRGRKLDVLGHRVVHGGTRHAQPARVTRRASPLAVAYTLLKVWIAEEQPLAR